MYERDANEENVSVTFVDFKLIERIRSVYYVVSNLK